MVFPGDSFASDSEKWGILQFNVVSHRISHYWLRFWKRIMKYGGLTVKARTLLFDNIFSKFCHGQTDKLLQLTKKWYKKNQLGI